MSEELTASQRKLSEIDAREEAIEQLRTNERVSIVGRLASNIAHELGTPINVISGRAMMIASGEITGQEAMDSAKIIVEQSNRLTAVIREFLTHARRRSNTRKTTAEVGALFAQSFSIMSRLAKKSRINFKIDEGSEEAVVSLEPIKLVQILTDLLTNAIQAMPNGGTITVGVKRESRSLGTQASRPSSSFVCIYVRDEGTGIKKEDLQNIFKPFYTTKLDTDGTGLGLSIAQGIVREQGGWIDVESELGVGSCFKVCLPEGGA